MPVDSGQKFIRRNRAPRVHITYEDPYDAEKLIELPFVMGVLADLSGNSLGSRKASLTSANSLSSTWITSKVGWRLSSPA
jgi:type VI secretion system protein ImpB